MHGDRALQAPDDQELAEHTGLSPSAVSYALRGLQVSAQTKAPGTRGRGRVGFRSDPIARALRGGATGTVGMLVGSLADFFSQELVAAVQRELRAAERHVLIADADGDPAREIELARGLVDRRVDGLIVAPIGPRAEGWAEVAGDVPTVAIGDELRGADTAAEVRSTTRGASPRCCAISRRSATGASACSPGRSTRPRAVRRSGRSASGPTGSASRSS